MESFLDVCTRFSITSKQTRIKLNSELQLASLKYIWNKLLIYWLSSTKDPILHLLFNKNHPPYHQSDKEIVNLH